MKNKFMKYKNEKLLYVLYFIKRLSINDIASLLDCSYKTIWRWLHIFKIETRSVSEAKTGKRHAKETKEKMSKNRKGRHKAEKSPSWKGGRYVDQMGHIFIYKPNHPHTNCRSYVKEQRLLAENILGRYLKSNEIVHHINENPSDNRNCNLLICDRAYHAWLHHKLRAFLPGL